jgi:hypothetical protein
MKIVLKEINDEDLRAYIIWMPVLRGDNHEASEDLANELHDDRVTFFWDAEQYTGNIWRDVLNLNRNLAWDIYFLYGKDTKWGNAPSVPDFWMHQLGGVTVAPTLDKKLFINRLQRLLNTGNE